MSRAAGSTPDEPTDRDPPQNADGKEAEPVVFERHRRYEWWQQPHAYQDATDSISGVYGHVLQDLTQTISRHHCIYIVITLYFEYSCWWAGRQLEHGQPRLSMSRQSPESASHPVGSRPRPVTVAAIHRDGADRSSGAGSDSKALHAVVAPTTQCCRRLRRSGQAICRGLPAHRRWPAGQRVAVRGLSRPTGARAPKSRQGAASPPMDRRQPRCCAQTAMVCGAPRTIFGGIDIRFAWQSAGTGIDSPGIEPTKVSCSGRGDARGPAGWQT